LGLPMERGSLQPRKRSCSIWPAYQRWLKLLYTLYSRNTASSYKSNIIHYLWSAGIQCPIDITRQSIQAYLSSLDYTPGTLAQVRHAIANFARWLIREGELYTDPCIDLQLPKIPKHAPYALTPIQADQILALAQKERHRLGLSVLCALKTGMRRAEIAHADWHDVNFPGKIVTIPKSKNGRARIIPLNSILAVALLPYRVEHGPIFPNRWGDYIHPSSLGRRLLPVIQQMPEVFAAGVAAHGPGRAWHRFRATFATRLAEKGVSPYTIMRFMGHAEITTTMRYISVAQAYDEAIELI